MAYVSYMCIIYIYIYLLPMKEIQLDKFKPKRLFIVLYNKKFRYGSYFQHKWV